MKKIIIVFLFLALISLSLYTYFTVVKRPTLPNANLTESDNGRAISHVNCSDIRRVVEENGKLYIACYGGVLIVDKNTGRIEKQITMAKGLSDFVTTDLIKKGNTLYIGTQDGVTIWDLVNNKATKLSVSEGLPNGANIELGQDGNYIWIGTFDGLARLNTENNQLQTFRKELTSYESEALNIVGIAITNNYAYFSVAASGRSAGSIARYNKTSGEWKRFEASDLQDNTQYARVDAFGICSLSNGVAFVEDKTIWKILDGETSKPSKIFTAALNDGVDFNILCSGNSILFNTFKNKFVYDGENVRNFNAQTDAKLDEAYTSEKNSQDFKKIFGDQSPGSFIQLLGNIEEDVFLTTSTGFWSYNTDQNKLTQISLPGDLSFNFDLDTFVFWPVEGTNRYVLAAQECGMGCDKPKFFVCNYSANQCNELGISAEAVKVIAPKETAIGNDFGYYGLIMNMTKEKSGLTFKVNVLNKTFNLTLRAGDLQWSVEEKTDKDMAVSPLPYTTETSFKIKTGNLSSDKNYLVGYENGIDVGDYRYKFDSKLGAIRINNNTKIQETLNPTMTPPDYAPFSESAWSLPQLNRLVVLENKIYYCTSRGLWIFDTGKNSWDLISIEDGLLSNEVQNFLIVGNKLMVLTPAGISVLDR